ncbi:MAG: S9 family peptidase, partial [Ginsengibacter sp.]
MKNNIFLILMMTSSISYSQIKYPETKKVDQVDNYFGTNVADPYRWLEDDNSEETKQWVQAENKVTEDYLSKIPFRAKVHATLEKMWNYAKYSSP